MSGVVYGRQAGAHRIVAAGSYVLAARSLEPNRCARANFRRKDLGKVGGDPSDGECRSKALSTADLTRLLMRHCGRLSCELSSV